MRIPPMKLLLPIILLLAFGLGYNYLLVAHGPAAFKAINGPKVNKAVR